MPLSFSTAVRTVTKQIAVEHMQAYWELQKWQKQQEGPSSGALQMNADNWKTLCTFCSYQSVSMTRLIYFLV